eukprot:SAG31_NODE_43112_length_268_cov_0.923077_1_plen_31_part_10
MNPNEITTIVDFSVLDVGMLFRKLRPASSLT